MIAILLLALTPLIPVPDLGVLTLGAPALAQTVGPGSPVPPAAQPQDPRERLRVPRPPDPQPELNIPAFRGLIPPGSEVVQVTLGRVVFEGATVFDDTALAAPFQPLFGQQIALAQVYAAAAELQARYRAKGYVLTRVVVPAQRIDRGTIRIRVVEGFIDEVLIEGEVGSARRQIERTMAHLTRLRPVRNRDLERYLLLANDIPGISATGVLRPGTGEAGATQLLVRVRRKRADGFVTFNNRESELTGPLAAAVGAGVNSLTRLGDRLEGLYFVTLDSQEPTRFTSGNPFEQSFVFAAYEARLTGEGTTARVEASYGVSRPGARLAPLDIESRVTRFKGEVRHPVVRTRAASLSAALSLESILERTGIAGSLIARDRLTVLGVDLEAELRDTLFRVARNTFSLSLRQGLEILGASSPDEGLSTRPEGSSVYTTIEAYLSRTQSLSPRVELFGEAIGHYASRTLLSQAEFRIGGDRFGRAFDPSQLAGEHGFGVGAELRFNGSTGWRFVPGYQLYAFGDAAQVRNTDRGFEPRASIWSTGAGIRTNLRPSSWTDILLDLEYAHGESFGSGPDLETQDQAYVRVTAQF